MPKIKKAPLFPFENPRSFYFAVIFLFLSLPFVACSGGDASSEVAEQEEEKVLTPKVDAGQSEMQDRLVFFEFKGMGKAENYGGITTSIEDQLHNHYAWPKGEATGFLSADSSHQVLKSELGGWESPFIHKFFSSRRLNELRVGNVLKVRLTWEEPLSDGRPQINTALFRNENHTWTRYANPGRFTFPSDALFQENPQLLSDPEIADALTRVLVRLTYK